MNETINTFDIFFALVEYRKWKNGYLRPYCKYFYETGKIEWEYTDFDSEEDFIKWAETHPIIKGKL